MGSVQRNSLRIFFPFWRADLKYPDSLSNLPDVRGRKPYPERKRCGLKKYLDTCTACKRGLALNRAQWWSVVVSRWYSELRLWSVVVTRDYF